MLNVETLPKFSFQVDRHLTSEAHKIALMLDNRQPAHERLDTTRRPVQPDIRQTLNESSRDSFLKLMRTAYEMVLTPSMPFKHFEVLVKCQRANGVRLVQGKDNSNAAREYVHYISEAIKEKCAAIIAGSHFISILSDGSQARKTNDEKELVLVRTERNGIPVYFVVSLLEMGDLGGTNANSIKAAIDGIFQQAGDDDDHAVNGMIPLSDYRTKIVSATADGASVNMGVYSGVLSQMKREREWLVTIHCVNHRLELALKDGVKQVAEFHEVDSFYLNVWSLLRNSGKLKSEIKKASQSLNITYYTMPKIHGTRFLNHRRRGLSKLLHNWPAIIAAFDNALATNQGYRPETRSKLTGFLKKLKSHPFLCQVSAYLDVLESMSPLSLIFEKAGLMAFEIPLAIEKTIAALEEISDVTDATDTSLSTFLSKFYIENNIVKGEYPKAGHERRQPTNREYIEVEMEMTSIGMTSFERAIQIQGKAADIICPLIRNRFSSYDQEVFKATAWLDPKLWDHNDKAFGKAEINQLCDTFNEPLSAAGFERSKVFQEWRSLKITQKSFYAKMESRQLWEKILSCRRNEFPNLCLLVELALCISASNSTVERVFSILSLILSDRRLSMSHKMMERCIMISGNDSNWSKREREELIERAVDLYMGKRRTAVFAKAGNNVAGTSTEGVPEHEIPENASSETPIDSSAEDSSSESSEENLDLAVFD